MVRNYPLRASDVKTYDQVFVWNDDLVDFFKVSKHKVIERMQNEGRTLTDYRTRLSDISGRLLFIGSMK